MTGRSRRRLIRAWWWRSGSLLLITCLALSIGGFAQTELAHVSGRVTDQSGAVVVDTDVEIKNVDTNLSATLKTNRDGLYTFPSLRPGHYVLSARKTGFKTVTITEFTLNAQDRSTRDIVLQVGSASENITVSAEALNINTTDATVSTVVDRQFAENLPLNGRSFQSLIELTPGVVPAANNGTETGQFNINGQRADANYWTVDGVSANIGVTAAGYVGQGVAGALGATNVFGGTNGLVSVDALEEFRIQTSTYAPEFGRTPGGQISVATRSGTSQFHGSLFEYFRNDALDANDWFSDNAGLPKSKERQHDFGGTFSGPIPKLKSFFFFSYEGMRLQLPQVSIGLVPDTSPQDPYSRQFAIPAMQPFMNAFPLPNGPEVLDSNGDHQGIAQLNIGYSNPGSLDAYSIRVDHKFGEKVNLFGRYNNSPSNLRQRGGYIGNLNSVNSIVSNILTGTVGATWAISAATADDLRFNYSKTTNYNVISLDNFNGADPNITYPYPAGYGPQNGLYDFFIGSFSGPTFGAAGLNLQRQINVVDSLSTQKGTHGLKFGIDYRRLTPALVGAPGQLNSGWYAGVVFFDDVPSADQGIPDPYGGLFSSFTLPVQFLFRNLGVFAQDTWRAHPRLTLTYGVRWDIDFSPSTIAGPNFSAATGFNLADLSNLNVGPSGTPPFATQYGNFAPRIGVAYELSQSERWQRVLRGGFGIFYDLATSESGNLYSVYNYPFGSSNLSAGGTFPTLIPIAPVEPPSPTNGGFDRVYAMDPHLKLPSTLEWNVALEQRLGKHQTLSATYLGASGRDLLLTTWINAPNPNVSTAILVTNKGLSRYNALQLQFRRQLSSGLQAVSSYTWSHAIDTGSGGTSALTGVDARVNLGNSDFDIRNAMTAGITYDIPTPTTNGAVRAVLHGWSLNTIFQARSAAPVDISYSFGGLSFLNNEFSAPARPDVVPGVPRYLYGSQYPGGKAINPAAFTTPPVTPAGCLPGQDPLCNPSRPGTLARNSVRGFGMYQWDFAVHREFPIYESLNLEFRAEMFNVLNHPNFGPPNSDLGAPAPYGNPQFGLSTQMLGQSLGGGNGSGGLDPLYQIGRPRSIQFALKLRF